MRLFCVYICLCINLANSVFLLVIWFEFNFHALISSCSYIIGDPDDRPTRRYLFAIWFSSLNSPPSAISCVGKAAWTYELYVRLVAPSLSLDSIHNSFSCDGHRCKIKHKNKVVIGAGNMWMSSKTINVLVY